MCIRVDARVARPRRSPTNRDDGVQETGGAAGWPVLRAADGLSQRSLRGLLDSRRTPSFAPPPRGPAKVHDCRRGLPGVSCSRPDNDRCCQAVARRDDQDGRASVLVNVTAIAKRKIARTRRERAALCSAAHDASRFGRAFGFESFQIAVAVIDVSHRGCDRAVAGLLADESMHRLRDAAIARMTLR
jgi:hypothetical protein